MEWRFHYGAGRYHGSSSFVLWIPSTFVTEESAGGKGEKTPLGYRAVSPPLTPDSLISCFPTQYAPCIKLPSGHRLDLGMSLDRRFALKLDIRHGLDCHLQTSPSDLDG